MSSRTDSPDIRVLATEEGSVYGRSQHLSRYEATGTYSSVAINAPVSGTYTIDLANATTSAGVGIVPWVREETTDSANNKPLSSAYVFSSTAFVGGFSYSTAPPGALQSGSAASLENAVTWEANEAQLPDSNNSASSFIEVDSSNPNAYPNGPANTNGLPVLRDPLPTPLVTGGSATVVNNYVSNLRYEITSLTLVSLFQCAGFQPPFDNALALKKTNRAIPLDAQLFDSNNLPVDPAVLAALAAAPPVVNVSYSSDTSAPVDETSLVKSKGNSSTGNQFNFDPTTGNWWFNFDSSTFIASGTYTVTLQSGDAMKYYVSPQCTGTFTRP